MRNMRKKQQQVDYVRPITTGHVEADMLGKVYLWVSERSNRLNSHRSHRKTYKRKVPPKSIFRVATECIQTAPTACLRSLKDRISNLRKQKRNGN